MSDERWIRIDRVLQSALERPPQEREAFIRDACADDAGVRDEVLSLLAHESSADKFLEPPPARAPLPPGARLGAYEIRAQIGEGGMGEVYRAHDSRLRRDIALKILPPEAADAERRQRFAREAQVVAALNHPGIVTIHSVEQSDPSTGSGQATIHFLTMELVDGKTLDALIPAGGLPIDRLLPLAIPLADAVGAAHTQGIVHRDLKPTNVMVTKDGRLKVMDFGLAKLTRRQTLLDAKDESVTNTAPLTEDGRIFGTVAYMSPEQAEGRDVDHRSDVFSLGVLLFEMATGRRPFTGDSAVSVLASIVKDSPPRLTDLKPGLPADFSRLVRKCLAKDPARRYQSVLDVRNDLEEIREDLAAPAPTPGVAKARRPWFWTIAGVGAALAIAASSPFWWRQQTSSNARTDLLFQNITDAVGMEESPAISADGKNIAYVAYKGKRRQIWVRNLNGGGTTQVTGEEDLLDHEEPRWVPNTDKLIYFARSETESQGRLWEVPMLGGQALPIASALGGGDISHDGHRITVFQLIGNRPTLVIVDMNGAWLKTVVTLQAKGGRTPRWSPDDRSVAYIGVEDGFFADKLTVVAVAGGERREVDGGFTFSGVSWIPDGSGLVYGSSQGSTIPYPPKFQLRRQRLSGGDSEQLTFGDDGYTDPDVYESGEVFATRTRISSAIVRVPTNGSTEWNAKNASPVTQQTSQAQAPSANPDGTRVVYLSDSGGHGNLWVVDAEGRHQTQITREDDPRSTVGVPIWSPAGKQIVYMSGVAPNVDQRVVNWDSTGNRFLQRGGYAVEWSPKGDWLYYTLKSEPGPCIYKVRVGDGPAGSGERIRCDSAMAPMPRSDGTLFFQVTSHAQNGGYDYELRKAYPEGAESSPLVRVDGRRVPFDSRFAVPTSLSPDGKWIAYAQLDGPTANLWKVATDAGKNPRPQRITDFGDRALWIVRQISWRGNFIFAPLADIDTDIVSITGVVSGTTKRATSPGSAAR